MSGATSSACGNADRSSPCTAAVRIAVSIRPGSTRFTQIRELRVSSAYVFASASSAAFEMAYGPSPGFRLEAALDVIHTTRPASARCNRGSNARKSRQLAVKFVSIVSLHAASSTSDNAHIGPSTPALATRMSSRPQTLETMQPMAFAAAGSVGRRPALSLARRRRRCPPSPFRATRRFEPPALRASPPPPGAVSRPLRARATPPSQGQCVYPADRASWRHRFGSLTQQLRMPLFRMHRRSLKTLQHVEIECFLVHDEK